MGTAEQMVGLLAFMALVLFGRSKEAETPTFIFILQQVINVFSANHPLIKGKLHMQKVGVPLLCKRLPGAIE